MKRPLLLSEFYITVIIIDLKRQSIKLIETLLKNGEGELNVGPQILLIKQ